MSPTTTFARALLAATLLAGSLSGATAWATTLYVYPDGHGSYPTIQAAINAAAAGDTVMLASGTYTGTGNREITYSGKAITVRSETGNPADCIIDCQSAGRGFLFINNETLTSVLRGITIKNGVAPGSGSAKVGGGIRCGQPFMTVKYGSPTIVDCVVQDCSAFYGGGMSCTNNSNPNLTNCVFSGNDGTGLGSPQGGGLYCLDSDPTLTGCTFVGNTAGPGGGLYCESCTPDLDDCVFANNSGLSGGGLCANSAMPTLDDCTFYGNSASSYGGGMYISGNMANSPLTNCTFYGNSGGLMGGGLACVSYAHPTLTRCIVAFSTHGEAVQCISSGAATIACCDIYGNAGGAGCVAGQIGSNNNIAQDPRFCHPNLADFTLRDVSPCAPANSPCGLQIGAWGVGCSGSMAFTVCPTGSADFATIQAAIDAAVNGDTINLCDATYSGAGNYNLDYGGRAITVRSASDNPQACIMDCGWTGDPNETRRGVRFHTNETSAAVLQGVKIINGHVALNDTYEGGAGIKCEAASPSITNCILYNNVTEGRGGGMDCTAGSAPALLGCQFENNTCGWPGGGGFFCEDSSPTFSVCTFLENHSPDSHGGGMVVGGASNVSFANCAFTSNTAGDDGGGLAAFAPVALTDCTFAENQTAVHGGGMTAMGSTTTATLTRCIFTNNSAPNAQAGAGMGGGLSIFGFAPQLQYCTFAGNTAAAEGGGVYAANVAHPTFDHCTFYGNGAPNGGGIALGWPDYSSFATLLNTIIAGSTQGEGVYCEPNCNATLACCDVVGNAGGDYVGCIAGQLGINGNISLPPIFCDASNGDFTVRDDSPCAPANSPPPCGLIGAWPVGCTAICRGDTNCDDTISYGDINPFVLALNNLSSWQAQFPGCPWQNCDVNGDGIVSYGDINPFVVALQNPGPCP